MADSAIEFLLNNLKEVVVHHASLINNAEVNIEQLEKDLGVFQAFLRDTMKMRKDDHRIRERVKEIHDVVYEIEDIIDGFVTKTAEKSRKSCLLRFFSKQADLHGVGRKVEEIKGRVERLRAEINLPIISEDTVQKPELRPPRKKDVDGLKDAMKDLIDRVKQETDYFDVISVTGMFGLGKTTLAWKVFSDPDILKFPKRVWLTVSQKFTLKELFLNILKDLEEPIDERTLAKEDHQLADSVAASLSKAKFLIVFDDVWSADDWKKLSEALPDGNPKGKVLITSRHEEVGKVASMPRPPYNLRKFKPEESWELFRLEALGTLVCPPELEEVGRKIAENCDGLPLAIVVIGGILAKSFDANVMTTKREWEKVSEDVFSHLSEGDDSKRMQKIISLSYEYLPYHLRACFLYLGLFPEDYEIPVSRLIRMWIGEGFIPQKADYTLEETGEKYLKDLISRNLVNSVKFKADGKVKTCQIHDTLRDFCRTEAQTENFLQEIKYNSDARQFVPPISNIKIYRRLSIHSKCLDFLKSKPCGPRVRSFVCFSENKYVFLAQNSKNFVQAFKLLRVLDALPFKFATIDSDLYNLVHMRYVALSFKLSNLPSKFKQLSNIQTLIINATESDTLKLDVKVDIWKMKHLRHFKTIASATLPKPNKSDNDCAHQLQTLGLISVGSCTEELPKLAPNLKKLGIRGKLDLLFGTSNGPFDNLGNMERLGKLKLVNDASPEPQEEARLHRLPTYHRFPSKLTSLTLCATFLSWDHISTLGLLKKLEVLKLKSRAFMGHTWEVEDGGFPTLQFLLIEDTDLSFWNALPRHYPKLRSLVLKNCDKLREIPIELADIPSLQILNLYNCILANKSARKIADAKKLKTPAGNSEFMLDLYPAV